MANLDGHLILGGPDAAAATPRQQRDRRRMDGALGIPGGAEPKQKVTGLESISAGEEEPVGALGGLGGGDWKTAGLSLL